MDKLGKLLRFVMQINSCIDCYFETQTFHPHLSYNPKSGWVGLFQPHVDIKDQFLHICIMLSNIRNVLETEWKLTPKKTTQTFPVTSSLREGADLLQLTPFFVSRLFLTAAWQLGLHFGIETRVFSSWYWWVISTWTQVLEDQVVDLKGCTP